MRVRLVALALAVVLAGCTGAFTTGDRATETPGGTPTPTPSAPPTATEPPTATPTATPTPRPPSPTPREAGKVEVSGLPLSFDEEQVYRDVLALHGRTYHDAPEVDLRVKERPAPSRTSQVWDASAFMLLWGFDPASLENTTIAGLAIRQRVFLYAEPVPTTPGRKSVLAHEYTHVLQHDTHAFSRSLTGIREGDGNVERVYIAVVEGTATYIQRQYVARHLNASPRERTWATYSANRSRFGTYVVAPYYFGERYVDQRVDEPENVSSVYDDPPTTTEQLLHGYAPDEEPARELSVDTETADGWLTSGERVRGELFVRLVLEGQLSRERAAEAAAGWGADRVVSFEDVEADGELTGHAWVLRWDSPAEADEFAASMGDYLDASATADGDRWTDGNTTFELRRPGAETVVVVAGPEGFVAATEVSGGDGDVTVRVGS